MLPSRLRSLYEIQHTTHITLYSMEGLRGLAVFLVFMVHYVTLAGPWIYNTGWFFQGMALIRSLGNTGVDLFFVLSGYLITGLLETIRVESTSIRQGKGIAADNTHLAALKKDHIARVFEDSRYVRGDKHLIV